ncbi:MAG: transcription termination/antitermination protein NusG [Akkermansiaceae bacterium]
MMLDKVENDKWYVVRAQPKREHISAKYIRKELGLEVVAPQIRYTKVTRRGKVLWKEAMFPGYLFVKFDRDVDERGVCYAPGVLKLVRFGDYVPDIGEEFVLSLRDIVGDEEVLDLQHGVELGQEYEVAGGALKGSVGEVVEVLPGGQRALLLMEMIGGERVIEVDVYSLLLPSRPDLNH